MLSWDTIPQGWFGRYVPAQNSAVAVDNLIKAFDRYGDIKKLSDRLHKKKEENSSINKAFKNKIIPKILKTKYKENEKTIVRIEKEIEDISDNLAKYATSLNEIINKEVLELKQQKDKLLDTIGQDYSRAGQGCYWIYCCNYY